MSQPIRKADPVGDPWSFPILRAYKTNVRFGDSQTTQRALQNSSNGLPGAFGLSISVLPHCSPIPGSRWTRNTLLLTWIRDFAWKA